MSKLLATELSDKVMYRCLQMFGGYGYMEEYKIARWFRDSRLGTIGGGSTEIMHEIISKMVIDDVSYGKQGVSNKEQVITIEDLFASLPSRFKKEKANGIELNTLFDFGNDLFYAVKIKDGNLFAGKVDNPQLTTFSLFLTTDIDTYIGVETGKLNPQEAFMSGKIKVSDLGKMMQFGSLFSRMK
jgi:hypothetical protein